MILAENINLKVNTKMEKNGMENIKNYMKITKYLLKENIKKE